MQEVCENEHVPIMISYITVLNLEELIDLEERRIGHPRHFPLQTPFNLINSY